MIGGLLCTLGVHHRDGRAARRVKLGYISTCKRCGAAMFRTRNGRWHLDDRSGEADA